VRGLHVRVSQVQLSGGQRLVTQNGLQVFQAKPSVVHLRGERLTEAVQVPLLTDCVIFAGTLLNAVQNAGTACTAGVRYKKGTKREHSKHENRNDGDVRSDGAGDGIGPNAGR